MTTYNSVQDGLWNDPATWGGGGFPQNAGDVANIGTTSGQSHVVTYNLSLTAELGQITVGATSGLGTPILQFARDRSTKLTLGHQDLLINQGGWLKVGESGLIIPKAYTAELVWHTTANNAKGINLAAGGKLNISGDPTYYGSKFNYLVATQVVIPAATNTVTVTVVGNYAANFVAGQELLIHKGGTYASAINDFARLAVVSAANNGANTNISCTVTERPAALTCLVGADVLNVSRNVLLYLLNYNANLGQYNSNRPRLANANAVGTSNLNLNDAVFGGWVASAPWVNAGVTTNNVVLRNSDGTTVLKNGTALNCIIFSTGTQAIGAQNSTISGYFCNNGYGTLSSMIYCNISGAAYGNVQGMLNSFLCIVNNLYLYSNNRDIQNVAKINFLNGSLGYDAQGNLKSSTYQLDFNGASDIFLSNTKLPSSLSL